MAAGALRCLQSVIVRLSSSFIPRRRVGPLLHLRVSTLETSAMLNPLLCFPPLRYIRCINFCSDSQGLREAEAEREPSHLVYEDLSKQGPLKPGLYLVGTPIGNLDDITLRALRVLKSADVILAEDTRLSRKLLQYYGIKTPLVSYHKFNEYRREGMVLQRLKQGQVVALISDAGMPGICDPGTELVKLCVEEKIIVVPVPGPSAVMAALAGSGLSTEEFTFVGFLPKHTASRRKQLLLSANQTATQILFVPPHGLQQFLEEASSVFGDTRQCVVARELTKIHEEFWRGSLGEAKKVFADRKPKGEITLVVEGKGECTHETPESQIEDELKELISSGHSLSMVTS